MSNHEQFEQLCVLAAAGEVSLSDQQVLSEHLETCTSCRSVFADMEEIHAKWLPECPSLEMTNPQSDLLLRNAILKRATREGARFSQYAQRRPDSSEERPFLSLSPRQWVLATAAVAVICVALAATLQPLRPQSVWDKVPAGQMATVPNQTVTAPSTTRARTSTEPGEARIVLERAIKESRAEQARLRQQLDEQERQTAALQQGNADTTRMIADLREQLEAARASQKQAEAELVNLKSVQATNEAITIAQQQEIRSLTDRLMEQAASLERERHLLSAGREIRDLIAARNLRIIDVYDTDSKGKTSRTFGRVFFTEGKSLVFYAYDLNERKPDSDAYAFYVWGKRDGVPQDIKSLGALAKDDQVQKRWVFTITDPKVLAEIDSVFVTLEPTDKPGKRPSGKRLLSAFLHTPVNHP